MQCAPIPFSLGKILLDSTLGSVLMLAVNGKTCGGGGVWFLFQLVGFSGQQIERRHRENRCCYCASHSTTLKGERERGAPLGESRALCFMNTESGS